VVARGFKFQEDITDGLCLERGSREMSTIGFEIRTLVLAGNLDSLIPKFEGSRGVLPLSRCN